ncbi:MAG: PAS domain-containing protein [Gracilimonas sp.]|uniref:PAS domain-containing protein n=1 Tax=Gracilimonas sp. TaxID=1974203 RepID=UPI001983D27D|nr:PAS domain-containing protein [Gracilimonas sp.]MBD3615407.1 PAS domain-containing protein [Gracilimonas sp.]
MKTKVGRYITEQFYEGLKDYLVNEKEEILAKAYEMGRKSLQEGYTELNIIEMYKSAQLRLNENGLEFDTKEKFNRASRYLTEWLAPYEVRLRSYRDMIKKLNTKNDQLEKEIENRKQAEKELQRSRAYFQTLIENAQDIITILDHKGIIRYESPSVERILGYEPKELNGRDAFQYLHEDDREKVLKLFAEVVANPNLVHTAEYRFRHKSGKWVYLESIAKNIPDSMDGPVVVVNSRDITDRISNIRKLEENKVQLAEAQRIAKVGSWEWNPGIKGNELEWSEEMCRIYGVKPENFDHSYDTFIERVHPDDRERTQRIIKRCLENKESCSFEHKIIRTDGEVRTLLCMGHMITDENDKVVKMIGTGQDVTEQKEKEKKLKEYSEQLRKLSARIERAREEERIRISREVHDELGQMLTVLKMDISMLNSEMREMLPDDTHTFFHNEAQKVLERINVIIKSVQRITTELRPEVLDDLGLKDAIEWQAQEFSNRTGIDIHFSSGISDTDFLDDEQSTTLFRIFQETLTNVLRHAKATTVDINLRKENNHIQLIIVDDGIGITQKEKEASTSLGLIGMRERTQLLGGSVSIEGEKEKGTKVVLTIPFEKTEKNK